jgi:hypothetical protein
VEFAPYQKVPSEKKKDDPRKGTIDQGEVHVWLQKSGSHIAIQMKISYPS